MTHNTHAGRTFNYRGVKPSRRLRRLCRRMIAPLALLCLVATLTINGYVRLGGTPAGRIDPYMWSQTPIFIASSSANGATTCTVAPTDGAIQRVTIPANEHGIAVDPWFPDKAEISCDHPVAITSGWHTSLAGYALNPITILAFAATALSAWWIGRQR